MSRVHVARDRQSLGQFSPEEVADGLKSGKFFPADLGWREPMETWKPLGEFQDLPEPEVDVEPAAEDLVAPVVEPSLAEGAPVEAGPVTPAWENRQEIGFFGALFKTIEQVLAAPLATFSRLKTEGGYGGPLLYFWLLALPATWAAIFYQMVVVAINPKIIQQATGVDMPAAALLAGQVGMMLTAPLWLVISAFFFAALFHLVFRLTGAATQPFEATFRVFCYGAGTAAIFQFIPLFGGLISIIITLMFLVFGMEKVHGTPRSRSLVAILITAGALVLLQQVLYTVSQKLITLGG